MYLLSFYVPETHLEAVKSAIFETGAGRIGNYDSCAFQIRGEGQFRPLEGSNPFIGTPGTVEKVTEYKVELVLEEELAVAAIAALRRAHPYEEPAFHLQKVMTPSEAAEEQPASLSDSTYSLSGAESTYYPQ
jgi:hypothetical protein